MLPFYCGHLDFMALELIRQRALFHLLVYVCKCSYLLSIMCERDGYWPTVSWPVLFGDCSFCVVCVSFAASLWAYNGNNAWLIFVQVGMGNE